MKKEKKMKVSIKIIVLSFLFILGSCTSELNVTPQDIITADNALTSIDDLESALLGAYSSLKNDGLYGEEMVWLADLMADNLRIGNSNGGGFRTEANWQYTSGTTFAVWRAAYVLIKRANTVINNADKFDDDTKKNRIVGQAYALRALGHFDLLRAFGEEYSRNSSKLAVPVVTLSEIASPPRNTVSEVYDQIFSDLNSAENLLSTVDVDPQIDEPFYFNKRAVTALLARVSLYAEDWQKAADYATQVINEIPLADETSYHSMWTEDTPGESIFSVPFLNSDDGRIGGELLDNTNPSAPRANITLTYDVSNLYDETNDRRFDLFVLINPNNPPGANPDNDDVYFTNKYPGTFGRGVNHFKLLRVSEMYLIRAEARAEMGQNAQGMADLNALRAARIANYSEENLTGKALMDAIQTERRKELVAEGHRWFDLRRIKQGIERGPDCRNLTISCSLNASNFRFIFPIPQSEIDANPNMVQNPGY